MSVFLGSGCSVWTGPLSAGPRPQSLGKLPSFPPQEGPAAHFRSARLVAGPAVRRHQGCPGHVRDASGPRPAHAAGPAGLRGGGRLAQRRSGAPGGRMPGAASIVSVSASWEHRVTALNHPGRRPDGSDISRPGPHLRPARRCGTAVQRGAGAGARRPGQAAASRHDRQPPRGSHAAPRGWREPSSGSELGGFTRDCGHVPADSGSVHTEQLTGKRHLHHEHLSHVPRTNICVGVE
jgi:hypothetical protein